jgi:hypothetical protein
MDLNSGNLTLINSNAATCNPAGGSCGAPLDILLDPAGATAFVLNQGLPCVEVFDPIKLVWICDPASNPPVAPTIYPYTVNSDGSLSAPGTVVSWTCPGANFSPCSDNPVAMGRDDAGQFLFVIDQGSFPSPGYPTPSPTNPSCPHVPTSATDVCPSISVFAIGSTGLTLESGSPFYLKKIPTALSAVTFTPSTPAGAAAQELLFVTNSVDICTQGCNPQHNDNTVSVYGVSSAGMLTEQSNSPYSIAAAKPVSVIAVNTSPVGENTGELFVYVGNTDQNGGNLNPFLLCTVAGNGGCNPQEVTENLLIPLQETCSEPPCNSVPPTPVGQNPVAMVVDPTNNFLYVLSNGSSVVYGFRIDTTAGTLAALIPTNQPTGSQPVAMALHPSVNNTGQFLYVSSSDSDNIAGFTLSTTTGSMSSLPSVITPAAPSGMAVH